MSEESQKLNGLRLAEEEEIGLEFWQAWFSLSVSWVASSWQRLPSIPGWVELQAPLRISPFLNFLGDDRLERERDCGMV